MCATNVTKPTKSTKLPKRTSEQKELCSTIARNIFNESTRNTIAMWRHLASTQSQCLEKA